MTTNELIVKLIDRVSEVERNLRNLIRMGNVKSIEGRKVVIDYEPDSDSEYYSPPIPWAAAYAGDVLQWRAPTIGEQMIVLNLSGGLNERHCIALPAVYCDQFLPATTDVNVMYTSFLDVFKVTTDAQGNYELVADETIRFKTKGFHIEADDVVSIQTAQYNRVAQTANTQGAHTQTGNVAVKGELDVSVSIKTPALISYTAGAFSLNANGATLSNVKMNEATISGIKFTTHVHYETGNYTEKPQ